MRPFSPRLLVCGCVAHAAQTFRAHHHACTQTHTLVHARRECCADVPFPKTFKGAVKNIFKRLFRVYAHIYYSHFEKVVELSAEAHLNTCFKHFISFVIQFDLVDKKELAPLDVRAQRTRVR
ncbi:hypothetical protein EON66_10155, partial [archaeon]